MSEEEAVRKAPYVVPKKDAKLLWDIVIEAAVDMINNERPATEARIEKFRRCLDEVVRKKAMGYACGFRRKRHEHL